MSSCDPCPWLMSMRDVMVDPKGSHADAVRDVMTDCNTVYAGSS